VTYLNLSEWFLKPNPEEEKQVQINHHKYCTKSELRTQANGIHTYIFASAVHNNSSEAISINDQLG
jgi:hypothetical protein